VRADDHEIEVGIRPLFRRGIEDEVAPIRPTRTARGRAGRDRVDGERRGGSIDREDVGVVLAVGREDEADDLRLVVEALGKSGRNGRSIIRQVRISFSVGRPSRLKKPPGILPAAYWYSLYSTVRGRKSTSFGSFV